MIQVRSDASTAAGESTFYLRGSYDIFISHSWRYDDEWTEMVALLDDGLGAKWRNWSLPWHDPGLDRFTPEGHAILLDTLDGQISQCGALLALADICKGNRGQTWLRIQIDLAKKHAKPIIGIRSKIDGSFPLEFRAEVSTLVGWANAEILPLLKPI